MRLDRQLSCTVPSSGKRLVRISAAWRRAVSASGEQLVTSALLIGSLVTVSLFIVPDLGTTKLSLIIPPLGRLSESEPAPIQTFAVRTLLKSSLTGSAEAGQGAVYTPVHLRGSGWNAF